MDVWNPYAASVKKNTCADIVFDKFHAAKKMNEALDSVRRQEFAKVSSEERKTFKKKRFIILTREERLDKEKKEELKELMPKNERLYEAYLLKEQLLSILNKKDEVKAREIRWMV